MHVSFINIAIQTIASVYGESTYSSNQYGTGAAPATGGLADTGLNTWLLLGASILAIVVSLLLILRLRRNNRSQS